MIDIRDVDAVVRTTAGLGQVPPAIWAPSSSSTIDVGPTAQGTHLRYWRTGVVGATVMLVCEETQGGSTLNISKLPGVTHIESHCHHRTPWVGPYASGSGVPPNKDSNVTLSSGVLGVRQVSPVLGFVAGAMVRATSPYQPLPL